MKSGDRGRQTYPRRHVRRVEQHGEPVVGAQCYVLSGVRPYSVATLWGCPASRARAARRQTGGTS
jgi:hypothetical protein